VTDILKFYHVLKDGINDPLDYPQDVDDIGGRTLAVKVKWQPNWKSGSIMAIIDDENFITNLQSQFPPDEVSKFIIHYFCIIHLIIVYIFCSTYYD
jgi:hypothetical protein